MRLNKKEILNDGIDLNEENEQNKVSFIDFDFMFTALCLKTIGTLVAVNWRWQSKPN